MALYENGKRISGIRDFPAYTWAEYHALPAAQRPKVWKCTDRDYTEIPDVFYKDIDVSGTVCSNYYGIVNTGIARADYLAISFAELKPWDENVTYSIGGGTNNALLIRSKNSSYTISANKVVRVFFVKSVAALP